MAQQILRDPFFVWSRYIAIALMLVYEWVTSPYPIISPTGALAIRAFCAPSQETKNREDRHYVALSALAGQLVRLPSVVPLTPSAVIPDRVPFGAAR